MENLNIITLNNLKVGDVVKVVKIDAANPALKRRIMDMGITKGIIIKVKGTAPFGDPLYLEVRGYSLSVRKEDLALIKGEVLSKKHCNELEK